MRDGLVHVVAVEKLLHPPGILFPVLGGHSVSRPKLSQSGRYSVDQIVLREEVRIFWLHWAQRYRHPINLCGRDVREFVCRPKALFGDLQGRGEMLDLVTVRREFVIRLKAPLGISRSEERRVGKECRSLWS